MSPALPQYPEPTVASLMDAAHRGFTTVPLLREVVLDSDTPVTAFSKLHRGEYGFLLESLEGGERWARYTFLATQPSIVHRYWGTRCETLIERVWEKHPEPVAPLTHLRQLLAHDRPLPVPGLPRFTGGAVGFWGYDVVRTLEQLPDAPADDRNLPDAVVMLTDTLLVLDHLFNRALVIANIRIDPSITEEQAADKLTDAQTRAAEWLERLSVSHRSDPLPVPAVMHPIPSSTEWTDPAFRAGVEECKEEIAAGDAFQIVLSRRMEVNPAPDPWLTYRWLRALNPAPYCYYLRLGQLTLVGASPEVLVRVEQDEVTVRPIAGTRPRGQTPQQDQALEHELRADPKECAEHLMLVDLGRNDVGRVAAFDTVRVVQQMVVERYSHVMHLVSEVRGTLRPELDALDALAAAFPAGTVSGAPKVRAMEIIDSLEPTRRGPYAGAVGYVGYGARTLDTAIAIRTAIFSPGVAWVQAGAGVVADSDPEKELQETIAKAGAVLSAMQNARRE